MLFNHSSPDKKKKWNENECFGFFISMNLKTGKIDGTYDL